MSTHTRKNDHIDICLTREVQSGLRTGFDDLRFEHCALPEMSLSDVDTRTEIFGHKLNVPIMISSMTGGTARGRIINRNLAKAAGQIGCAMGLGSMRILLEDPKSIDSFKIRDIAPNLLLFANFGLVQFNYGLSIEKCIQLTGDIEADGLILHLNPLQEAIQPEGDTNFQDLILKVKQLCKLIKKPVIVKEVGWGISASVAKKLIDCGVAAIDVAGAGGTSWSEVEKHRTINNEQAQIASAFKDWGLTTIESVTIIRNNHHTIPLIASGGLRNGVDLAKCIALGANMGGFAKKLLIPSVHSSDEVVNTLNGIIAELRIAMYATGAINLKALTHRLSRLAQ